MVWTGLTISPAREEVIDFSYPFWEESIGVWTTTETEDQFFIYKPLHIHVWICFIGMSVIAAAFIWYLESRSVNSGTERTAPFTRWDVCLLYIYGAMCNQGEQWPEILTVSLLKAI